MPPRLIVALCTGPVTMPAHVRDWQAAAACSSAAITAAALRGSGTPGAQGAGTGTGCRRSSPGRLACSASGSSRASGSPRRVAASCSEAASPNAIRSASQSRCAARTHSSGPTPAGSPGTSASRGRMSAAVAAGLCVAGADVDVGFAAHLAHVAVPLVFQLALADRLADLGPPVLVAGRGLAGGDALHDVPAGLGLERRRDLAILQRRHLGAELGTELVLGEPAQVAALGLADRIVGVLARDFLEVGAAGDARAQRIDPGLGLAVAARAFR